MFQFTVDMDREQFEKDMFSTPSGYRLDDRFVLHDGKRHPFAVICPGGAYQNVCSYIEGVPYAKRLNARGYSAFIVYYRTAEKALYPAPQEDLARAVKEILAHADAYEVAPDRYSIWGSSAGGHLAASFGTAHMGYTKYQLPKPAALILTYPVISMDKALTERMTHDNLLGKEAAEEQEHSASVDEHITPDYPPTYIWCGEADKIVKSENTKRMAAALENAGVRYQCEIFPDVDHGVGPGTGTLAEGWIDHAIDFWEGVKEGQ